jgi:hypothetical protein
MQLVMASPLVLHTFIFATTKQMLCLRGQREDDMSQQAVRASSLHQNLALSCARTELESMEGTPSDGMILAIIILAVNGTRPQQTPPQSHPRSPLATTQSLHLFSTLNVVEAHVRAVAELIELKGGLQAVETYGVRDTILLHVDLVMSCRTRANTGAYQIRCILFVHTGETPGSDMAGVDNHVDGTRTPYTRRGSRMSAVRAGRGIQHVQI